MNGGSQGGGCTWTVWFLPTASTDFSSLVSRSYYKMEQAYSQFLAAKYKIHSSWFKRKGLLWPTHSLVNPMKRSLGGFRSNFPNCTYNRAGLSREQMTLQEPVESRSYWNNRLLQSRVTSALSAPENCTPHTLLLSPMKHSSASESHGILSTDPKRAGI